MISDSDDGELIARLVRRFGNEAIRGSARHGALKALKGAILHLRCGRPLAITPDGPQGPAFKVKDGIVAAAQTSGVPIIPLHYEATRQWILSKSWDHHRIPKPFTSLVVSYGEPIYVPKEIKPDEFQNIKLMIEERMLDNMEICQRRVAELR